MFDKYHELGSSEKTGKFYKCDGTYIRRLLRRHNIPHNAPSSYRKRFFNETIFEIIDTEEKAYWLGFFSADGCIMTESRGHYTASINLAKIDWEHVEKFRDFLGGNLKTFTNKASQRVVQVSSKKFISSLNKLGLHARKSLELTPPVGISDSLMRHYWRGFIDGDGWVYRCISQSNNRSPQVGLCGTFEIVEEFRKFLLRHGVETRSHPRCLKKNRDRINHWRVEYSGIHLVTDILNIIYKNSSIFLDRKKIEADSILARIPLKSKRVFKKC